MRDGVNLSADHYAPATPLDVPTILIRSPYGRNNRHSLFGVLLEFFGHRFAERGYHVLVQDTRGRFDSGGEFYPFKHESEDGYDTIEWAAALDYSNGMVGMFGGSYVGDEVLKVPAFYFFVYKSLEGQGVGEEYLFDAVVVQEAWV